LTPDTSLPAVLAPSPNHGVRKGDRTPDSILLHYTGLPDGECALRQLCDPAAQVSAHYLIWEDGRLTQLVPESRRAWHAGQGVWAGESDMNDVSIGIEIANPGHDHGYPDFPPRQIAAVTALCRSIQTRNNIAPVRILAHSDVAPARKQDPGEKFPWRTLYESGVGHWVKPAPIMNFDQVVAPGSRGEAVIALQKSLRDYGYGIEANGEYDAKTVEVVIAFQRHFRPERVDGHADPSTRTTLQELLASRGRPRTIAARARTAMLRTAP
jgi:N-acetylmuramoyl-L-alanine amidase